MNNKSIQFLNDIMRTLQHQDLKQSDVHHITIIFELIKQDRFDDLKAYINDDIAHTDNKNYAYRVREKLAFEIYNHLEYVKDIESNE